MDGVFGIVIGVLLVISALILIVAVLFQTGKDKSLSGAIAGGTSDTFYGKNKSKSRDSILNKITVVVAVVFAILVLISFIMQDEVDLSSSFDETTVAETTDAVSDAATSDAGSSAVGTTVADTTAAPETNA